MCFLHWHHLDLHNPVDEGGMVFGYGLVVCVDCMISEQPTRSHGIEEGAVNGLLDNIVR